MRPSRRLRPQPDRRGIALTRPSYWGDCISKSERRRARSIGWGAPRKQRAAAPSDDDHHVLLCHLGVAARALGVFMELQSDAGEYRDVGERVGRLARFQTGG